MPGLVSGPKLSSYTKLVLLENIKMPVGRIGRVFLSPVISFLVWLVVMLMYIVNNVATKVVFKN